MRKKFAFFILFFAVALPGFTQKYRAVVDTDQGKIIFTLFDQTPQHRDNFVKLAREHFYDGTLFHRVIPQFMIQGGDPKSKEAKPGEPLGSGDVGYRIPAEIRPALYHKRGAVAAARDNNPEKASSGCQFYIVDGKKFSRNELEQLEKRTSQNYTDEQKQVYESQGGAPHLDGQYTVFGQVTKGMDVVDKIAAAKRNRMDRPDDDQRINSVRIQKRFLFFWR